MTEHGVFIAVSYGVSIAGLIILAAKSWLDMQRFNKEALNLRAMRRGNASDTSDKGNK